MNLSEIIDRILGEQNLYRIDRFKHPDKRCRHNELYRCDKCKKELDKENKLKK